MARKKLTERQKLVKALDDVVSDIVILRDKKCVTCGRLDQLNCSHLISRQKMRVRWDIEANCNCQCWPCNSRHNHYPHFYTNWFIANKGEKAYKELCEKAEVKAWKWSIPELREMLDNFQDMLVKMTAERK